MTPAMYALEGSKLPAFSRGLLLKPDLTFYSTLRQTKACLSSTITEFSLLGLCKL